MYCVKCGQATYDSKYCDKCRCVFCPNSDEDCQCARCHIIIKDYRADKLCNGKQLPGQRVCYNHYCPVCLSEHNFILRHCFDCNKFAYFIEARECKACGRLNKILSSNFNCAVCECMYCDNIHCIVHKCLLCDHRISFNDPDMKYCEDHACKRCMYAPVVNGLFCADCSVNRTVGTQTKRAN